MPVRDRLGTPVRHSLRWRLSASIALLIGAVLMTFVWLAHRTLERTLLEAGGARLTTAAGELARLLERGQVLEQLAKSAGHDAVVAHVRQPAAATAAAARAHLTTLTSATVRRVEIWNAAGARVLTVEATGAPAVPAIDRAPSSAVSPMATSDGILYYDLAAPVPGGLETLVVRSAFTAANPQAIGRLVGDGARVMMGNSDGSLWSDLTRQVAGPGRVERAGLFEYVDAAGTAHVGVAAPVTGAPWIAWVEFPRAALVAAADAFLARMIPIAILFLAIGAALAWIMSSRITRPLAALSKAAEAVAAGDYTRRLHVSGRDEVGRLAHAFNVMTAEIEESHARLEARVAERTAELAAARVEADSANRAKSEFLSLMSHDLRTPLNAILGFAQLLEGEPLTPAQADHVSHILVGGRHLLALISDVLDITRIESGQLGLSVEPVAAREFVLGAVDLVRPLAQQRGITLHVDDVFEGVAVKADGQRFNQILLNLLSNAVKYNRTGGAVSVSGLRVENGCYRITVTDTGIGLSDAQRARLFRPFERLGAEQTAVEGTGLGLALSRALADAMGGSLGVSSASGRGSTFWVDLPEADAMPEAPAAGARDLPYIAPTRGGLVLYVEDNLSNVRLLQRILERRPGVELLHAGTGADGIALARDRRPDLVLLDVHLPDTSGQHVLRAMAADPRSRDIPKVMVTADATPGLARRLEAEGALASLTKPLNVAEVLRLVDRLLKRWPGEPGDA